ncbi:MAG: ADP-forming succinate--CoA ligase subunit beta [Chlamydiia bacterium]|nr:ADP-forming succinate--CoA ligase subunit beta [Chlamydiia bacterium]
MNIHEYQAKEILKQFGVPVPPFGVASNEAEVRALIQKMGLKEGVIKVQVHAGGRGKAGGVKFAKTPEEIITFSKGLMGMKIVNNQTGPTGVVAEKVLISPPVEIKKEYYLAAIIDRDNALPMIIASPEGGMEIEEIAVKSPEKIMKVPMGLDGKIRGYHLFALAKFMGWEGETRQRGMKLVAALASAFSTIDSSLFEINPLIETFQGELFALDAKCGIDDNALYRQKEIAAWYDPSQQTKNEVLAKKFDLAYVGLSGNIGCMVNGAGLAMATMDIIHTYGGEPANFLDVGGGASKEKVAHGFTIILLDPNVKAIFVNIFGGIMDCGVLAAGIVEASKEDHVPVPLVVRMEGTNVDKGKEILKKSGLNIMTADTMADGAQKALKACLKSRHV